MFLIVDKEVANTHIITRMCRTWADGSNIRRYLAVSATITNNLRTLEIDLFFGKSCTLFNSDAIIQKEHEKSKK